MSLTISQVTDFRLIEPSDQATDLGFRTGYHCHNTSRAGEGMIIRITDSGYGPADGCWDMTVLVLSGTFQAGDVVTCNPSGGFTVGTIATATHNGILVSGTMSDTDSTRNTNQVLNATETTILVNAAGGFIAGQIIRIDDTIDEYCYILKKINSTSIQVKRGLYGTAGVHATNKDIYIVHINLYEQILDADAGGGWGYSTATNGRIEINAHIIHGRSDAATSSILISSMESVDIGSASNNCFLYLGSAAARTYTSYGVGWLSDEVGNNDGVGMKGSILRGNESDYSLLNYANSTTYFFDTSLNIQPYFTGSFVARNWSINCINSAAMFFMVELSKAFNTFLNHAPPDFGSTVFETNNMFQYSPNTYGIYWVSGFGNATVTNLDISPDSGVDGGFVANGIKTMINCKYGGGIAIFWGNGTRFKDYKTFDCEVKDKLSNCLKDVQVKCNYRVESTSNVFTALTDPNKTFAANITTFDAAVDNIITANAHGLINGKILRLATTNTLPAGLSLATNYYVIEAATNTFKLSTSLNGGEVDITNTGTGTHTYSLQEMTCTAHGLINGRTIKPTSTVTVFTADASDVCTKAAHNMVNGSTVKLYTTGTLPAGLNTTTLYYVVEKATDTFKLSTSLGGGAVNITDAGTGVHTYMNLPSGLNPATLYYIVGKTTNTFQFSATLGGAAVNITDAGTGTHIYVLQDFTGKIDQQLVLYDDFISSGSDTQTRNIEYFISKSGYKTISGRVYISNRDDPIKLRVTLKKNRFREERSLPQ